MKECSELLQLRHGIDEYDPGGSVPKPCVQLGYRAVGGIHHRGSGTGEAVLIGGDDAYGSVPLLDLVQNRPKLLE